MILFASTPAVRWIVASRVSCKFFNLSVHTHFDYGFLHLPDQDGWLTKSATSQQWMLFPPRVPRVIRLLTVV